MQTIDEIISDLQTIAKDKNYEGATVDALIYLMASGIYKNQMNNISTALELSPTTCTLTNSAIQHAQDKVYSVYRGKNQHILLRYVVPNETKEVKKYDVCTRLGKYKLLYARDYKFETGTRYNGDIELILCENLIEEKLNANLRKYVRAYNVNFTEDLDLYINDNRQDYVNNININIQQPNYLNQTCDTPYLILTDTDYGIICWCYNKDEPDLVFDTNYTYSVKSPAYLEDTIDASIIKSIPGFDITETLNNVGDEGNGDGIILLTNLVRESDVDNIYIESSTAEHSGNIIRAINDIKSIFLSYFAIQNIRSCKSYIEENAIRIVYLLQDKNKEIPESYIDEFLRYLSKAYYVDHEVIIEKAWAYKVNDYDRFTYAKQDVKSYKVTLRYDCDEKEGIEEFDVEENNLFKFPNEIYTKNYDGISWKFMGWKLDGTADTYAISGKDNVPASTNVSRDLSYSMVWRNLADDEEVKHIDIYTETDTIGFTNNKYFYQRINVFKYNDEYISNYEPEIPHKDNQTFTMWMNNTNGITTSSLSKLSLISTDNVYVGSWNYITYSVQLVLTNDEIYNILGLPSSTSIIKNQIVKSGDTININNLTIPSEVVGAGGKLVGFYILSNNKKYKFDLGTPIKQNNMKIVAMYEKTLDLDLEIYFDSPLNNTELHTFVDSYSYNIGEVFEPMKIATQLTKKYDGIAWTNLRSSKENIKIPKNSYFDFSYNLEFNNE